MWRTLDLPCMCTSSPGHTQNPPLRASQDTDHLATASCRFNLCERCKNEVVQPPAGTPSQTSLSVATQLTQLPRAQVYEVPSRVCLDGQEHGRGADGGSAGLAVRLWVAFPARGAGDLDRSNLRKGARAWRGIGSLVVQPHLLVPTLSLRAPG